MAEYPHPLVLIRHGETDWNRQARFQGSSDTSLNAEGHRQAKANAQLVEDLISSSGLDREGLRVFASPLARARQSAQAIAKGLHVDVATHQGLREISLGRWEGLTSQQVKDRFYQERKRRKQNRWEFAPVGGESLAQRSKGLRTLLQSAEPNSVMMTHSGIIRIVLQLLGGVECEVAAVREIPHLGLWLWDGHSLLFRN